MDRVDNRSRFAAPLGTDDEAAGAPPSPEVVDQARREERRSFARARRPNAVQPELTPNARIEASPIAVGVLLGAAAALAVAAGLYLAL